LCVKCFAQEDTVIYVKETTKFNRDKAYNNIIANSITKNLSLPLTDSTEENWQDAFYAMELINYKASWVNTKIKTAFNSVEKRSIGFQRALLELTYTNYPKEFIQPVAAFAKQTDNPKLFAMCAEYLFKNGLKEKYKKTLLQKMSELNQGSGDNIAPFFTVIKNKLLHPQIKRPSLEHFLKPNFLKNEVVIFSFQRKNRNFPGIVIVRDKNGKFIKNEDGQIFSVKQLARSITNLPGYITNGNTPQGIFKITGFAVSNSIAIGPTQNIQLLMPFEKSEEVADSVSQMFGENYNNMLPDSWKDYYPVYESWYAGKAGRTEIISHGTTVDPAYYKNQPYYPLTPTLGCLCTKEIWSLSDGRRLESNQQKLVNAVKKAGGAEGFCLVIEIDDQQKPVSINEILSYLK